MPIDIASQVAKRIPREDDQGMHLLHIVCVIQEDRTLADLNIMAVVIDVANFLSVIGFKTLCVSRGPCTARKHGEVLKRLLRMRVQTGETNDQEPKLIN